MRQKKKHTSVDNNLSRTHAGRFKIHFFCPIFELHDSFRFHQASLPAQTGASADDLLPVGRADEFLTCQKFCLADKQTERLKMPWQHNAGIQIRLIATAQQGTLALPPLANKLIIVKVASLPPVLSTVSVSSETFVIREAPVPLYEMFRHAGWLKLLATMQTRQPCRFRSLSQHLFRVQLNMLEFTVQQQC